MPMVVLDAAIAWISATATRDQKVELTLHGGEPLVAGHTWFRCALSRLRACFGDQLKLGMQSNLWLLDHEYCDLFHEHGVLLGTSLDGPQTINDSQRGAGSFHRTMAAIDLAHRRGFAPGVICTLTRISASRYREIVDFFAAEGLPINVHMAVQVLGGGQDDIYALSPEEHSRLLVALFDYYVANLDRMRIVNLDDVAQGISARKCGICTFNDCIGNYLAIGPDGGIYPCNRFVHLPHWRLGFVQDMPTLEALAESPGWRYLRQRELGVSADCGDCIHFPYCKGGCAYNALSAGRDRRDPHCIAYYRLFSHIIDCAIAEVFSEANLEAVIAEGLTKYGLMQKGPLLQIMRGGPHLCNEISRAEAFAAAV